VIAPSCVGSVGQRPYAHIPEDRRHDSVLDDGLVSLGELIESRVRLAGHGVALRDRGWLGVVTMAIVPGRCRSGGCVGDDEGPSVRAPVAATSPPGVHGRVTSATTTIKGIERHAVAGKAEW